jgi:hypothetical protein
MQTHLKLFFPFSFVILSLLALLTTSCQLFTRQNNETSQTTETQTNTNATAKAWKTYTQPNKFSIAYPAKWFDTSPQPDYLVISTEKLSASAQAEIGAVDSIKTDVIFVPEAYETAVEKGLAEAKGEGSLLTRKGEVTIGGNEALRLWVNFAGADFPNAIVSYIHYSDDKTAVIISGYNAENPQAVDTIQRVHWSFRKLEKGSNK